MPIVFEKDGYKFFFYSNKHEPVHVHVRHSGGEAVFEVETKVELRESQGMKMLGCENRLNSLKKIAT